MKVTTPQLYAILTGTALLYLAVTGYAAHDTADQVTASFEWAFNHEAAPATHVKRAAFDACSDAAVVAI
jgi:hypothetical protein